MSKQPKHLCLICVNLCISYEIGHYERSQYGYRVWIPTTTYFYCGKTIETIHKIRQRCKNYLGMGQTTLGGEKIPMVNIDKIPEEAERVDLGTLPAKCELQYVGEETQPATTGKTGGLVITYKMRDGKTFPQKYSAVSGKALKAAMKRLKLKDTTELGQAWYEYELTAMRVGYPRMIPIKKL